LYAKEEKESRKGIFGKDSEQIQDILFFVKMSCLKAKKALCKLLQKSDIKYEKYVLIVKKVCYTDFTFQVL